ncbi:MAG TPA: sulfatase-like hydrolase/transferase, partial [Acidimicrobiales bacterium]|nr:sulfatase-like hydrolase/transferase [Acidimicrobiales bacterium]
LRATYHGMQTEVDAQLGRLLEWLEASGLAGDTLVLVTSDHGELGGDHWCIGKGGWFDASFWVPLIVRDPRRDADPGRGRVVRAPTEAVDVMPTILEWIGAEVPLQADGWSLRWALDGREVPEHWRRAAHMEWDFRNPARRLAEQRWGLPSAHCVLTVLRSGDTKYVQFAADAAILPPLLFDLGEDPGELHDVARDPRRRDACHDAVRELLQWRMREDDRELANSMLTFDRGLVRSYDPWR